MNKKRLRNERGSVALEAVIIYPLMLLILFTILSMGITQYCELRLQNAMQEVASELSLIMFEDYSDMDAAKLLVREVAIEGIATVRLNQKLSDIPWFAYKTSLWSSLDQTGMFTWRVSYKVNMPLYHHYGKITYPVMGILAGDGVNARSPTVYITRTGAKYHEDGCFHLRQSKFPIDLDEAIKRGYGACKTCH